MSHTNSRWLTRFFKRAIDITASLLGLIILSPMLGIVYLLVRVKLGKPVLFAQERPGLNGKIFTLYKFRTMTDARDEHGNLLPDDVRLTPFGAFLRSASLDEFPELFNVLKGDMSLVGPRPLLTRYLDRYTPRQARRHDVRPGITGWAQVNGRNLLDWNERFELDVWYVDNYSIWLDIKILFKTVIKVFRREGTSAPEHVTMPEFEGTQSPVRRTATIDDASAEKPSSFDDD